MYNPDIHTPANQSFGMAQAGPTDARSYFFENYAYRPYHSETEVLDYLKHPTNASITEQYRSGNFPIFINDGDETTEWWFQNGTADTDLKQKSGGSASENNAGVVMIATEDEMKLTADTADDDPPKVPSRQRIYAWWKWIRDNLQEITSVVSWKFTFLAGDGERIVSALPDGDIQANIEMAEEITTDANIISACQDATDHGKFTVANGFTASVVPPSGITFFKGQKCKKDGQPFMYIAFDNNVVARIPLG